MRAEGLIPGVLYGRSAPHAIAVEERELRRALHGPGGMHTILDVTVGDQATPHPSVLKEFQQHPVSGRILHIDLQEVRLDQPITVAVSVHLIGESPGAKEGGILSQQIREVSVEALPMEVPEHLELDISSLAMGDALRLTDIPPIEGVTYLDDPDTVLVTVSAPRALEVEEAVGRGRGGRGGSRGRGCARGRGRLLRGVMRLLRRGEHASTLDLLVAGLGNPGREYERTRHNAGWLVVDELARRHGASFRGKFSGRLAETRVAERRIALLKPETYMNESGRSIAPAARFFKLEPGSVLVVHDDVDLELGRVQVRLGGGLAGHNGLRSVAQSLGTPEFLRLRLGVGRPGRGDRRPVADYVLSPFAPDEDAEALITLGADAVEALLADGLDAAQARFN